MLDPKLFSRDTLLSLDPDQRAFRIEAMEQALNVDMAGKATLRDFQDSLYTIIEMLEKLGFIIGRLDYDCEKEYWATNYFDAPVEQELQLLSWFPHGIKLGWGRDSNIYWQEWS